MVPERYATAKLFNFNTGENMPKLTAKLVHKYVIDTNNGIDANIECLEDDENFDSWDKETWDSTILDGIVYYIMDCEFNGDWDKAKDIEEFVKKDPHYVLRYKEFKMKLKLDAIKKDF